MNWDDKSDSKVNSRLAELLKVNVMAVAQDGLIVEGKSLSVDYCNSWADMGPLIIEHEMCLLSGADCNGLYSVIADIDYWSGMNFQHKKPETHIASGIQSHDKNPLRAAAICLIKKLEAEQ